MWALLRVHVCVMAAGEDLADAPREKRSCRASWKLTGFRGAKRLSNDPLGTPCDYLSLNIWDNQSNITDPSQAVEW